MVFRFGFFVSVITLSAALISGAFILYMQDGTGELSELIGFWVCASAASALSAAMFGTIIKRFVKNRWLCAGIAAFVPLLAYPFTALLFGLTQAYIIRTLRPHIMEDFGGYLGVGTVLYTTAGSIFTGWLAVPLCILVAIYASRPFKAPHA